MKDRARTPLVVQVLWMIAGLRVVLLVSSLVIIVWLAFPEPSSEWWRGFRGAYLSNLGYPGQRLDPSELGAILGANTIPWILVALLPVALWRRSLAGVRWILGLDALVAVASASLSLIVAAIMFVLTLPKNAWPYWYGHRAGS